MGEILWNDSYISTIDKFLDFISSKRNISEFKFGSEIEYLKNLIDFICKMKDYEQIFRGKRLFINQSGDLRTLEEIDHIDLPDILYKMLDSIGYNYQCRTLHPEFNYLYDKFHFRQFGCNEFVGTCINNLNVNNAPNLMQFVVESDENRELMYKYTKLLINPNLEYIKLPNDNTTNSILNIFTKADNIICKIFIRKIFNFDFEFLKNINFSKFIALIKKHLTMSEFGEAGLEKLLFQKCLSDCEKELSKCGKFYNIECIYKGKIELRDFITNEKYNFRAKGQNDNDFYYFMVRQSEYFTFQNFNYSQNRANPNGHYVLFIVFNAEREQPDLWKLESIK